MMYAFDNGERVQAEPGAAAECPGCGAALRPWGQLVSGDAFRRRIQRGGEVLL